MGLLEFTRNSWATLEVPGMYNFVILSVMFRAPQRYFFLLLNETYGVTPNENRLNETVLMRWHNLCF